MAAKSGIIPVPMTVITAASFNRSIATRIADELERRIDRGDYVSRPFPSPKKLVNDEELRSTLGVEKLGIQSTRTAVAILVGRRRIAALVNRKLGFRVQQKRRGLVGLLTHSSTGDFAGKLADGLNEQLAALPYGPDKLRYRLVWATTTRDSMNNGDHKNSIDDDDSISELARETDGVIFLPSSRIDRMPHLQALCDSRFPIVLLGPGEKPNDFVEPKGIFQVVYDETKVAREIGDFVQRLLNRDGLLNDPEHFIAIVGESSNTTLFDRANEIYRYLNNQSLNSRLFHSDLGKTREAAGENAIQKLLKEGQIVPGKTLVIATTDLAALGALKSLKKHGNFEIPAQVKLMGVDDDEYAEFLGLTSVKMFHHKVGMIAAQTVFRMIEGDWSMQQKIKVEGGVGKVQERDSTGNGQ